MYVGRFLLFVVNLYPLRCIRLPRLLCFVVPSSRHGVARRLGSKRDPAAGDSFRPWEVACVPKELVEVFESVVSWLHGCFWLTPHVSLSTSTTRNGHVNP